MKPVTSTCEVALSLAPEEIAGKILDVANRPEFGGYGPLPGVRSAAFEVRTPGFVGSRIRAVNTDGSSHVEEIVEWRPDRRVVLRMSGFSPPLSRLATTFDETWEFGRDGDLTRVVRSSRLRPESGLTRPPLVFIAVLLLKAVARHLRRIRDSAPA